MIIARCSSVSLSTILFPFSDSWVIFWDRRPCTVTLSCLVFTKLGDAILATWRCSDIGHNAKFILNKVINCSLDIQANCDNFDTEVGIVLRVKLAIAVGPMCLTFIGLPESKQFDLSGASILDVGLTEKQATPGSIILSQLAWANCEQDQFASESLEGGKYFKVCF